MKLVLALMVASLFIGAGTVGDLGSALSEGFDNLGENTDYRINLNAENEEEAKDKLSQAAKFVRMRAGNDGCAEDSDAGSFMSVPKYNNEEDGFPALSDTYIGRYPTCEASTSTLSRGIQGGIQELGQDQEGIYSRVAFKVTGNANEDHEINLDTGDGGTWLEGDGGDDRAGISAIKEGSLERSTQEECSQEILQAAVEGAAYGAAIGSVGTPISAAGGAKIGFALGAADEALRGTRFVGTGDNYVIFVRPNEMDDRVNKWVDNAENGGNSFGYEDRLYCHAITESVDFSDIFDFDEPVVRSPLRGAYIHHYNEDVEMKLCPGDEGYIQMNKAKPQNDAEAGEDWLSGAGKYPYIEITEKGSCEGEASGSSGGGGTGTSSEPVSGTVTTEPATNNTGDSTDILEESGSSLNFDPGQSSNSDDYIAYQPLPEGPKTVTVKVEFSERGHFQIEAQEASGDFPVYGSEYVSFMHTDLDGAEDLWIQEASGDHVETDSDYETGKTYTFELRREAGNVSWTVKKEGTEIFTNSSEGQDFERLQLESWQDDGGSANPVVEIKEVTIEENSPNVPPGVTGGAPIQ